MNSVSVVTPIIMVFTFCMAVAALAVLYFSKTKNQAGPDGIWIGGRGNITRRIFFRLDGSFRRYTRAVLTVWFVLIAMVPVIYFLVARQPVPLQ